MIAFKTIASAALIAAVLGAASVATATAAEPVVAVEKAAASAPSQSRDDFNRRVRVHNNTGWTMTHFYASDERVDEWQEDMLGSNVLAAGSNITMNIDDGSGACLYDFKARFSNGEELERFSINVCEIADYYYTR